MTRNRQYAEADFLFTDDSEIIALEGFPVQPNGLASSPVPSISPPYVDVAPLLEMMQKGCYLRLTPESDLPLVILRSLDDVAPWGPGFTQRGPGPSGRELRITRQGVWCPPLRKPLLFPPIIRYLRYRNPADTVHGLNSLTGIGGYCTNPANPRSWLAWYAHIEASLKPFPPPSDPNLWRMRLTGSLLAPIDGNDFEVYSPALPNLATARVPIFTHVAQREGIYTCSVTTANISHGYLNFYRYFGFADPLALSLQTSSSAQVNGVRIMNIQWYDATGLNQWFRMALRTIFDVTGGSINPGFFVHKT